MSSVTTRPVGQLTIEQGNDRLPGMDAARVIAAIGVVWIHTPQSAQLRPSVALGRMAVPFFLGTSILLILRSLWRGLDSERSKRALIPFWQSRCRRLLLPFAGWSAIYLALKVVKKILIPNQANDFPGWEAIFFGTAYHLWFLPFLWAVSMATFLIGREALVRRKERATAVVALYIGLALAAIRLPYARLLPDEIGFMWLAAPGLCWAFSLAIFYLAHPVVFLRHRTAMQATAWMALLGATALLWSSGRNATAEAIAGLALIIVALTARSGPWVRQLGQLAPLAYGVYLSHLMVLKIGEAVAQRLEWAVTPTRDLCLFAIVVVASTSISKALSRSRHTRWLIG